MAEPPQARLPRPWAVPHTSPNELRPQLLPEGCQEAGIAAPAAAPSLAYQGHFNAAQRQAGVPSADIKLAAVQHGELGSAVVLSTASLIIFSRY